MNWNTVKNWFIIAFLFLNIVLGWQVVQSRSEMRGYVESYSDILANTKTLLAEHGFSLASSVPSQHPDMSFVHATLATVSLTDLAKVVFQNSDGVDINSTSGVVSAQAGMLRTDGQGTWQVVFQNPPSFQPSSNRNGLTYVWMADKYAMDPALSQTGQLVFDQQYNGYSLFDTQLVAQIAGNKIQSYTQTALTDVRSVNGPKPTISAMDALDSLANSVDKTTQGADNKILRIDLGYVQKLTVSASDTASSTSNYWFPVWRIVTPDAIYFINAFTGEVERSS